MYYQNLFNRKKTQKSYSVKLAKQLGIMLIFFVILLLFKFTDNPNTVKINNKIREIFYQDMTKEVTEVFKNRLESSEVVFNNLINRNDKKGFSLEFLPVEGKIVSQFGKTVDETTKKEVFNNGILIETKEGSDVKAVFDGVVESVETGTGLVTIVIDHGNQFKSVYGFLSDIKVNTDDRVVKGTVIGKAGKPENSNSVKLYFEVDDGKQPVNPLNYLKASTN